MFPLSFVNASGTAGSRQEIRSDHAVIQAWLKYLGEETWSESTKKIAMSLHDYITERIPDAEMISEGELTSSFAVKMEKYDAV